MPVVSHFHWPTSPLQGLDVARNLAFKNCKNQFYFKGRQTVSKHETAGIKEILLASFRPGKVSAPGNFPMEPTGKSQFHLLSNQILWKPFVKQWQ